MRVLGWLTACALTIGCGRPAAQAVNGPGSFVLTIQDYTFDPQHLEVPPGATIVVLNHDHFAHTVTSAAAAGTYVYGEVNGVGFDTGPFRGTRTVTIPAAAPVGTVVPYFCAEYRDAMLDAPDITIVTPAQSASRLDNAGR